MIHLISAKTSLQAICGIANAARPNNSWTGPILGTCAILLVVFGTMMFKGVTVLINDIKERIQ